MSKLPANKKSVVVYQYLGYRGSFAQSRKLLWKCVVLGADGDEWDADHNSWHGHPEKRYAVQQADRWAKFTGWPIVEAGRCPSKDDQPKDIPREERKHGR